METNLHKSAAPSERKWSIWFGWSRSTTCPSTPTRWPAVGLACLPLWW